MICSKMGYDMPWKDCSEITIALALCIVFFAILLKYLKHLL